MEGEGSEEEGGMGLTWEFCGLGEIWDWEYREFPCTGFAVSTAIVLGPFVPSSDEGLVGGMKENPPDSETRVTNKLKTKKSHASLFQATWQSVPQSTDNRFLGALEPIYWIHTQVSKDPEVKILC